LSGEDLKLGDDPSPNKSRDLKHTISKVLGNQALAVTKPRRDETSSKRATKRNSNSLANQLGIHIILAKQEKLASNSLANQLGKNGNLAKLTSPRAYMRAQIVVAIVVSL
jgi:hypothetical protein